MLEQHFKKPPSQGFPEKSVERNNNYSVLISPGVFSLFFLIPINSTPSIKPVCNNQESRKTKWKVQLTRDKAVAIYGSVLGAVGAQPIEFELHMGDAGLLLNRYTNIKNGDTLSLSVLVAEAATLGLPSLACFHPCTTLLPQSFEDHSS